MKKFLAEYVSLGYIKMNPPPKNISIPQNGMYALAWNCFMGLHVGHYLLPPKRITVPIFIFALPYEF